MAGHRPDSQTCRRQRQRPALLRAEGADPEPAQRRRAGALRGLPDGRTPDRRDWERIAGQWQALLDRRIEALQLMRRKLGACIGCGCLSLEHCALYNPEDRAAAWGSGPRYLLGDEPPQDDRVKT